MAVTMGYTVIMILRRLHNDKTITSVVLCKKGRKEKLAIPNMAEVMEKSADGSTAVIMGMDAGRASL